jgi:hypothetical protein
MITYKVIQNQTNKNKTKTSGLKINYKLLSYTKSNEKKQQHAV